MPVMLYDWVVYMPNKAGANNAVINAAKRDRLGGMLPPRNGLECDEAVGKRVAMTSCDEFPRLVSMWHFMSEGRMSRESKFCDTDFSAWCELWLEQRAKNKRPSSTNSWFLTMQECMDIVKPEICITAEAPELGLIGIGLNPDKSGISLDAYRHRRDWLRRSRELQMSIVDELKKCGCWYTSVY